MITVKTRSKIGDAAAECKVSTFPLLIWIKEADQLQARNFRDIPHSTSLKVPQLHKPMLVRP